MLDCAQAAPLWTAAANPRVLSVIARPGAAGVRLDIGRHRARVVRVGGIERVYLAVAGHAFRLDVTEGSFATGPVAVTHLIAHDERLTLQLATVRQLASTLADNAPVAMDSSGAMYRMSSALRAWDARSAGASLRETAVILFGEGEWPGPGEYRKSAARRLVAMGDRHVAAGPLAILRRPDLR